jgi:hypothetical protein
VSAGCPGRGLAALACAARKAAPTPAHLTPAHVDVLQLSLLALNYAAALPLLADDIFEVVPSATGLVPKDFLLYCFYGGSLLCAVKRFGRAVELFMQALTAPALALNAIQLACYKKMARRACHACVCVRAVSRFVQFSMLTRPRPCHAQVLASLLSAGTVPALPKFASSAVTRHVKARAHARVLLRVRLCSHAAPPPLCAAVVRGGVRGAGEGGRRALSR